MGDLHQPKIILKVCKKGSIVVKSRDPQKAHLGRLLNIHNKFQLPSLIWRGVMRGTN